MNKLIIVTFKIEPKILDELDTIAERRGLARSELLREIILDYLDRERRKRRLRIEILKRKLRAKEKIKKKCVLAKPYLMYSK